MSDAPQKRLAQAEQAAARALERAAEAGRQLLESEARAARDRAAAALNEDALAEARARHSKEVADLRGEIERLEDELERHRQWLVSIQASTSWKITKPLRTLSGG